MHTLAVFILASSYSTHTYTFFITDSDIYYSRKTDSCPTEVRLNSGSKVDAVAELDRRDRSRGVCRRGWGFRNLPNLDCLHRSWNDLDGLRQLNFVHR